MTLVVFEEDVLRLICGYSPPSGRRLVEKQSFYDELIGEWDMHCVCDLVMCLGYFNGHVGRHIDGFDSFHGGYGIGKRNSVGRMLLVLTGDGIVCQIHGLKERKRGRLHSEFEKIKQKLTLFS